MEHCVIRFRDVTSAHQASAGGKGGMLARMLQAGYPVPDGFVILPAAFQQDELALEAWELVAESLRTLRRHQPSAPVAVRSSALSEDSDAASFAGEFESVLNVRTEEEVREAIAAVRHSGRSERVQAYSRHQGMTEAHQVAVVVQLMVPAALAGVLFTADPITGSHARMSGNYVHGLGERLVSGEADAQPFSFERPKGIYTGPEELKPFAKKLYALAARLERELKKPQDIEWALADGKLFILQARPVTTLRTGNPDTYEWNDSLDGDFLWTNTNVGEAMSDVFTPLSWSMIRKLDEEQSVLPGYYLFSGNICGRAYTNISLGLSLYPAFGKEMTPLIQRMSDVFGHMPEGVRVPVYPFSRMSLLRTMIPLVFTRLRKMRKAARAIPRHLAENAEVCAKLTRRIQQTDTAAELALLWRDTLLPLNFAALWAALTGGRGMVIAHKLNQELTRLAGQEDANTLLSNLRGDAALESLGPVIGISRVIKGDMSQEEYKRSYGHRGPHEFELSFPHPGEANDWLEAQMEQFAASGVNVEALLQKQNKQYEEARERLNRRQPAKTVKRIGKQLQKIAEAARLREAVRSEWTRTFRVNRAFALQAGKLTGIGEAVHFLYIDELLQLLGGDRSALKHVPARRETHEKYKALPPLPSLIRGRFDAQQWAGDPHRRVDYYDAGQPAPPPDRSETLKGFAGAAGRVEGSVRVLYRPEEGGELQAGEILVASTTNVGWTPLFPRAAAIITDIGAPLSHAAIVARELGIPAVVGCGSATARLKTGDRVIVDGGQGLVYLVDRG